MDLLGTLKWACLEVNNCRTVLIDDVVEGDLGSAATIGNVQGTGDNKATSITSLRRFKKTFLN